MDGLFLSAVAASERSQGEDTAPGNLFDPMYHFPIDTSLMAYSLLRFQKGSSVLIDIVYIKGLVVTVISNKS